MKNSPRSLFNWAYLPDGLPMGMRMDFRSAMADWYMEEACMGFEE